MAGASTDEGGECGGVQAPPQTSHETYGSLALERYVKDDSRALIVYTLLQCAEA